MKHNKRHLAMYYINWLILTVAIIFTFSASCQIAVGFTMGRTDLFYPHGNGSDPLSFSVEAELNGKIGYVQFRQSFFEDQPIFNNYDNPGRNQIEWIEQLAAHAYFLKTGKIKASAGGAVQYQWGKLLNNNRWRLFPEVSLYYELDDRFNFFTREAWFHYREYARIGFVIGWNYKL